MCLFIKFNKFKIINRQINDTLILNVIKFINAKNAIKAGKFLIKEHDILVDNKLI